MASSSTSIFAAIVLSSFLDWSKACDPMIFYPEIKNVELLSTSESKVLLTIEDEDSTDFCVTYDWAATPPFSEHVQCVAYTNDILDGSPSDIDPSSSRVNSISVDSGIDMTRNSHSFVIPWSEFPDVAGSTIEEAEIESFTLNSPPDHYVTFLRLSLNDVFAIQYESATSNNYLILNVESNTNFDFALEASDVQIYDDYKLMMFVDTSEVCNPLILYEYEVNMPLDDTYSVNLTEIISDYNIMFDDRTGGYVYFWGYADSIQMFDVAKRSMYLDVYGIDGKSTTSNAPDTLYSALKNHFVRCALLLIYNLIQ